MAINIFVMELLELLRHGFSVRSEKMAAKNTQNDLLVIFIEGKRASFSVFIHLLLMDRQII